MRAKIDSCTNAMHRCQVHKLRNILEYLPEGQRIWVRAIVTRAYKQIDVAAAQRLLQDLARRLEDRFVAALRARDQHLGLVVSVENIA